VLKAKKMQKTMKYTIFRTKWGYFGLASTDNGLLRTCLPLAEREKAKSQLLQNLPATQLVLRSELLRRVAYDKALFKTAQQQVIAYFEGDCINFRAIPVVLDGLGLFARRVLTACRDITFGQTVSYGRLAEMTSNSAAARAVGGALARNPLPLIIPCHRVICANGEIGGFSVAGGRNLKEKLLKHEYQSLTSSKNS
jgi:methylated-DNA-[protein]-cysteine S-methyltransferase